MESLSSFFSALMQGQKVKHVAPAFVRVHERYCEHRLLPLKGMLEHIAYSLYRMPATLAALERVLERLDIAEFSPSSLLDLGSGPGTAIIAARRRFPSLNDIVGLEQSPEFLTISQKLVGNAVQKGDLEKDIMDRDVDLVVASYSFGELTPQARERWIHYAAKHARAMVLVEPGTPQGWKCLMECRDQMIAQGMFIAAPCPHHASCPFVGTKWWCHEAVRLPRTRFHRWIKGGRLGYEDEKFSYIIGFSEPIERPECRIVHAPRHRSGHTHLSLCQADGQLKKYVVSRRNKELYSLVKRVKWGDAFPNPTSWREKDENMCSAM